MSESSSSNVGASLSSDDSESNAVYLLYKHKITGNVKLFRLNESNVDDGYELDQIFPNGPEIKEVLSFDMVEIPNVYYVTEEDGLLETVGAQQIATFQMDCDEEIDNDSQVLLNGNDANFNSIDNDFACNVMNAPVDITFERNDGEPYEIPFSNDLIDKNFNSIDWTLQNQNDIEMIENNQQFIETDETGETEEIVDNQHASTIDKTARIAAPADPKLFEKYSIFPLPEIPFPREIESLSLRMWLAMEAMKKRDTFNSNRTNANKDRTQVTDIAKYYGISRHTLSDLVKNKWKPDETRFLTPGLLDNRTRSKVIKNQKKIMSDETYPQLN